MISVIQRRLKKRSRRPVRNRVTQTRLRNGSALPWNFEPLEERVLLSVAPDFEWIRQFGSVDPAFQTDAAQAADADGNVYVAGETRGTLAGQISVGGQDAFVRKYDASGSELWTRSSALHPRPGLRHFCGF